ncbi:MAG: flagellar export chaperone FliS [Desulfobacteraceae bacterium]|nr:flagellar export chaperone FliS [Desulfobacteraceae bacterium]
MNPYMNHYQQNQVKTASPEQILILLYEGAIRFLKQAKMAMEEGDRVTRLEKISRALAIITELSNTLDFEKGGEVAENLDALYAFITRELTRSNMENDPAPVETAIGILTELHEAWCQAAEAAKNGSDQNQEFGDQSAAESGQNRSISVAL